LLYDILIDPVVVVVVLQMVRKKAVMALHRFIILDPSMMERYEQKIRSVLCDQVRCVAIIRCLFVVSLNPVLLFAGP
jgi:hypothetical protein